MEKYLIILSLLLLPLIAGAEIYKGVDQQGNPVYSDQPVPGGQSVQLPPDQVITVAPPPASPNENNNANGQNGAGTQTPVAYQEVSIINLTDGQTLWNTPQIPVMINSTPALQPNDKFQLVMDGQNYGAPTTGNQITMENVPRGTHTISVHVVNQAGQSIAQSPTITLYIHQAALGGNATVTPLPVPTHPPTVQPLPTPINPPDTVQKRMQQLKPAQPAVTPLNPPKSGQNSSTLLIKPAQPVAQQLNQSTSTSKPRA